MTTTLLEPPLPAASPASAAAPARRAAAGGAGSAVGFAWLRSSLQATAFRRQTPIGSWTAPGPVRSFEEFDAAIGAALAALGCTGGDAFLLLEQVELRHRAESAPAFSPQAARSYLAARIARQEENGGPILWCAQPTATARQDSAFLLHLLPAAFYERMDRCFAARGLELSRIFPLAVPLALELLAEPGRSRLIAVETDGATTIAVAAEGRLAFARTLEACWSTEAARVGMEVNRSLLYAKQQLGAVVQEVTLLGAAAAIAEVRERCGAGRAIVGGDPCVADWLQRVAGLAPAHPQNLIGARRRRAARLRLARAGVAAALWILLVALAALTWDGIRDGRAERRHFAALQRDAGALRAERDALLAQDRQEARDRALLQAVADGRRPAVPLRTLAGVSGLLPAEIRLTDFAVQREPNEGSWSFHLGGTIEADEDTARSLVASLQEKISHEPWQARWIEGERMLTAVPAVPGAAGPGTFSFTLGGTLP